MISGNDLAAQAFQPLETDTRFRASDGNLEPELLHGLAHERGKMGGLLGSDQIAVNHPIPVLVKRASPF